MSRIVVLGGGLFGLSGAIELARRGHWVALFDPGPIPHPDAASTDLSKIVRPDYGADELYTELAERSIDGWRAWNEAWGEELFHPTGLVVLCRAPLEQRAVESATFELLRRRGHAPQALDARAIAERFPLWRAGRFVAGYVSPRAGWVASGRAIARLARDAREAGVEVVEGARARPLALAPGPLREVAFEDGARVAADVVLLAAGAWTAVLHPALGDRLWATAQPVTLLAPDDPSAFRGPAFPVWAADITRDGWYGFPATDEGVLKVANHGTGERVQPAVARDLPASEEARARAFLADALPSAADAPRVGGRRCLYSDSFDGDFLVAADPDRPGLVVAAGGSGHAFKFAPVLGGPIADACEGRTDARLARWAWRARGTLRTDVLRAREA